MHAVAAFFASIIAFVGGMFGHTIAAAPSPDHASQVAAVGTASADSPFAASPATTPATSLPSSPQTPSSSAATAPATQRVVERTVIQQVGISQSSLAAALSALEDKLTAQFKESMGSISPKPTKIPEQVAAAGVPGTMGLFPASQRIDQITNTTINTPTVTGGSISGASSIGASGGSFDALSAGTLSLSGALTGTDASFSGTLSAGVLNVASLSTGGALTAPYFTATSTTATSVS